MHCHQEEGGGSLRDALTRVLQRQADPTQHLPRTPAIAGTLVVVVVVVYVEAALTATGSAALTYEARNRQQHARRRQASFNEGIHKPTTFAMETFWISIGEEDKNSIGQLGSERCRGTRWRTRS